MNIIENNKKLIEEYPFLLPRNVFSDKIPEDYDYSYTELDQLPDGWRKAFGLEMCKEIKEELVKNNLLEEYRILQIKEKFGGLRWYSNHTTKEIEKIIRKYEKLSFRTCLMCGEKAEYMSTGWISPFCANCIDKKQKYVPIDEFFEDLKEEDN